MIIKEGPSNFSGGRSPHWVNHVNMCLSCIVCLLCFVSAFVLFYCSAVLFSNIYPDLGDINLLPILNQNTRL
jgi:hypothetical protein